MWEKVVLTLLLVAFLSVIPLIGYKMGRIQLVEHRRSLDRTGAEVVEAAALDDLGPRKLSHATLRSLEHRRNIENYDWSDWRTRGVVRATAGDWCTALVLEPDGDTPYTITDCDEVPAARTDR